jgi:hypothetical protein
VLYTYLYLRLPPFIRRTCRRLPFPTIPTYGDIIPHLFDRHCDVCVLAPLHQEEWKAAQFDQQLAAVWQGQTEHHMGLQERAGIRHQDPLLPQVPVATAQNLATPAQVPAAPFQGLPTPASQVYVTAPRATAPQALGFLLQVNSLLLQANTLLHQLLKFPPLPSTFEPNLRSHPNANSYPMSSAVYKPQRPLLRGPSGRQATLKQPVPAKFRQDSASSLGLTSLLNPIPSFKAVSGFPTLSSLNMSTTVRRIAAVLNAGRSLRMLLKLALVRVLGLFTIRRGVVVDASGRTVRNCVAGKSYASASFT